MRFSRLLLFLTIFAASFAFSADFVPPMGSPVFNHVRFYPAPYREKAMVGGKFSGSNVSAKEGFEVLCEITETPREQQWTDLFFPNKKLYRWLRYDAPPGSHGCLGELEFYSGDRRIDGQRFASVGEKDGRGWQLAFDGDPKTWVEMEQPDGQFAGVDLLQQATPATPTFLPPPVGIQGPLEVAINELMPIAGVRYTLDGSLPTVKTGELYTKPLKIDKTTTVVAAGFVDGLAPSPPRIGTFLIGTDIQTGLRTLHLGNNITGLTSDLPVYARTAGRPHEYRAFVIPGADTRAIWEEAQAPRKREWEVALTILRHIDHLTLQPHNFKIEEEVDYEHKIIDQVRGLAADVQPWLFAEWTERERPRPSDRGEVPSFQMSKTFPALSWEESMSAMLLYVEEVQHTFASGDHGLNPLRVLPTCLAMGWARHRIEHGGFPGTKRGDFYNFLFRDSIHPNEIGAYLVDLTLFSAFYRQSPEGKVLPAGLNLTSEQNIALQRLAWDVIENYPDAGIYHEGSTPCDPPVLSPAPQPLFDMVPIALSAKTPGAWFRYTLDGSKPTPTNGYVYSGVISLRPGMTLKAVAFKNGLTPSAVTEGFYPIFRPKPEAASPRESAPRPPAPK